ncbi:rRNA adenine N-6-methyltransferase family protein [Paenibacillus sp. PK3_47]|uniref:class I SAM-dependent methyltransferase n=1 Tax=Paenibacillus sp. PK3_47 TaxID=2072642 RepID=UPI00201D7837|nr:rRNA adenine N-6-methyltransferase family protein [Paenibacillus sp. PK3_47]
MKEFLKNPCLIGTMLPTQKHLADKIIKNIEFSNANYIVEYGPGTGAVTEKLLEFRNKETTVILFEKNKLFCEYLKYIYRNEPNLYIINDSAMKLEQFMNLHDIPWVDYIISSIPLNKSTRREYISILYSSRKKLMDSGAFITFQRSLLNKKLFSLFFRKIELNKVLMNIPPAYILCCKIADYEKVYKKSSL